MESAFGIDHGEVSKGMPKGLLKATGKGQGGYATSYVGNRKSAHFTGRLLARGSAKGRSVFPHAGQRYASDAKRIIEVATQRPRKKRVLP
jgi:hypothetical protein